MERSSKEGVVRLDWRRRSSNVANSPRVADIALRFGLESELADVDEVRGGELRLAAGRLVVVIGASGAGKSTALEAIERQFPAVIRADRLTFSPEVAVVDRVAGGATTAEAIRYLTLCGLGEPALWLRRFSELSTGEQFRARLARAVGHQAICGGGPILCDEFCTGLHDRLARAIAFSLRRLVTRQRLCVVVATSREELLPDLQPDILVTMAGGQATIENRAVRARSRPTFARLLRIEPGGKADYAAFSAMHYRGQSSLGFVDRVLTLRVGRSGYCLGIVVYARPPLELSLRNQATGGRFVRNPRLLNASLRVLRRLVIHPDVRGCGLGAYLVRKTLPLLGTEYVECLATMGTFHPVFERAGMQRIGQYPLSRERQAAIRSLADLGVDPMRRDFVAAVARQRRVRAIVSQVVHDWYARTTVDGEKRVCRQAPLTLAQTFRGLIGSMPVYYLWRRPARHSRRAA